MAELQRLLARNGIRIGAIYDCGRCKTPDDVARRFGLHPIGEAWREVNRATASSILRFVLERDLAYESEADTAPIAAELSRDFIQQFSNGAKFFTNARWNSLGDSGFSVRSIEQWTPATDSTFDSGILVLHEHRIGVYWL